LCDYIILPLVVLIPTLSSSKIVPAEREFDIIISILKSLHFVHNIAQQTGHPKVLLTLGLIVMNIFKRDTRNLIWR